MLQLKCPKCGTVNISAMPAWPRCQQCKEFLLKCRYCKFIDSRTWECTHPRYQSLFTSQDGGRAVMDPDALINCALHESTLAVKEEKQRRFHPVVRVAAVALVACLVLVGLVWRASRVRNAGEKRGLEMEVFCPTQAEAEHPMVVRIVIRNFDDRDSGDLRLRVSNAFFNIFELQSLMPLPQDMTLEGTGRYLYYGGIPARSEMLIQMTCVARHTGYAIFSVSLLSRGYISSVGRKQKIEIF